MEIDDFEKIAKEVLHDLEIELETRVGALEHEQDLIITVSEVLNKYHITEERTCNCTCRICKMADEHKQTN